jgi:hypothetical protein
MDSFSTQIAKLVADHRAAFTITPNKQVKAATEALIENLRSAAQCEHKEYELAGIVQQHIAAYQKNIRLDDSCPDKEFLELVSAIDDSGAVTTANTAHRILEFVGAELRGQIRIQPIKFDLMFYIRCAGCNCRDETEIVFGSFPVNDRKYEPKLAEVDTEDVESTHEQDSNCCTIYGEYMQTGFLMTKSADRPENKEFAAALMTLSCENMVAARQLLNSTIGIVTHKSNTELTNFLDHHCQEIDNESIEICIYNGALHLERFNELFPGKWTFCPAIKKRVYADPFAAHFGRLYVMRT